jgi:hypothetical protein
MKRWSPSLLLALAAPLVFAWSPSVLAANCSAGKAKFQQICESCHTPASRAGRSAADILNALAGQSAMAGLFPDFVNATDVDNIAAYLFVYPAACPASSPTVSAIPASLSFGNVDVGATSAAQTITLANSGTADATGLTSTSSNNVEFPVTSTCGSTLAAGASCTLNVAYAPNAAGAASATLTIGYTGGPPLFVALSGTGVTVGPATATAIEYYHQGFDHYFITAIADEITKLDNGTFVGWARTGKSFKVFTSAGAGLNAVCRFFSTAFAPKSSHFYTPLPAECTVVKSNPSWMFEAEVFFIAIPALDGACPTGTSPVYRIYNNGQGAAPNHRYTTDLAVRTAMLALGWIPEGYGPIGVIMCAP